MDEHDFVVYHKGDDPALRKAATQAQNTFKHFWYQVTTDFNRLIPALEFACVKAPFSDDFSDSDSPVEHMWIGEINFDGVEIHGTLLNIPNQLAYIQEGDTVRLPLLQLSDWLCVLDDRAYGGYSVQVLRSRMNAQERQRHDAAWGFKFPPPDSVLLPKRSTKFEQVCQNLLVEQIAKDSATITQTYEAGRTLLHLMSLYGRASSVRALLNAGALPTATCDRGWTALDYASSLGWDDVISELQRVE
ncbi:DUF2314 domain-containing protein [Microcoleus sp. Pol14C2]|uniref:DUF2314 domain-containing protein n=1 Tax=unclassified Microcoleus TaxID=2642155 RepID=UPI002FD5B5DF